MAVEPQHGRLYRSLAGANLLGPIFTKELRISARQKRNYWLRFLYVFLFMVILVLIWYSFARISRYSPLNYNRRTHEAVMMLLVTIGCFQFFTLQLVAPILTCTAISDEANRCTLDVLLTTPITSLQIVLGKLFSKMLIMIFLTATTLPMLALIRVFGGIEWRHVIWILGLTMSSAFFNATLGLLFSIFFRRSYVTILAAYFTLGILYFLIPFMIVITTHRGSDEVWFTYFNPFASLFTVCGQVFNPRYRIPWLTLSPAIQCSLQLAGGILAIIFSTIWVRRKVLNQVSRVIRKPAGEENKITRYPLLERISPPREVTDRPVLWRELHIPLIRNKTWRYSIGAGVGLILIWIYGCTVRDFAQTDVQVGLTVVYQCLIFVTAIILSAPTVSREKETNTWEMLMTTPLTGREIVWGKTWGILNRVLPVSLLYFSHIIPCACTQILHPFMLVGMIPLIVGPVFFLVGTGILISQRVKKTVTAVVLTFVLATVLWVGLPAVGIILDEMARTGDRCLKEIAFFNPIVLNCYIVEHFGRILQYNQQTLGSVEVPFFNPPMSVPVWFFGVYLWVLSFGYFLLGFLSLRLAGRRRRVA